MSPMTTRETTESAESVKARVDACVAEIDAALAKHGCLLSAALRPVATGEPNRMGVEAAPIVAPIPSRTIEASKEQSPCDSPA